MIVVKTDLVVSYATLALGAALAISVFGYSFRVQTEFGGRLVNYALGTAFLLLACEPGPGLCPAAPPYPCRAGCRLAVWGLANTLLARRVERGCAGGCACSDSAFGLSRLCNFVVSLMICVGMFALAIACSARPDSLLRRLQTGVSDADLQQLLLEWKLLTCPAAHGAVLDREPAAELTAAGSWELAEEEAAGLSCTSDNLGWSSAQDDALGWVAALGRVAVLGGEVFALRVLCLGLILYNDDKPAWQ